MSDGLGELTRTLLKPGYDPDRCCPAPEPHISKEKKAILFIGMNPAGDEEDAVRDNSTGGLFLNYYEEFDEMSKKFTEPKQQAERLMYKTYFNPILRFFVEATGGDIAWEWCNYSFDDLRATINQVNKNVSVEDIELLRSCYEKYKDSEYQIIVRDLVYYHQTKDFKKLLKPAGDVKENVKEFFNCYIEMFPETDMLKLIYVSSATSCCYIENALLSSGYTFDDFGTIDYKYNGTVIPVVFAGRALSGAGTIDNYSKRRLLGTVKAAINK